MFHRLVVPLDGSRLAESVLPVVRRLGALIPVTVKLLHVIEKRPPSTIHGDAHLRDVHEAEGYLGSVAERLRAQGLEADTHVHTVPQGDVAKCIAEHGGELDGDLIVLCAHGAGGLRRFVFGSNAEQVLSHGSTPVMLIQADDNGVARSFGPDRILVLSDCTPATETALEMGAELATLAGSRLHLLAVVPTPASMKAEHAASGRFTPQATRRMLDLAAEEAVACLQDEVDRLVERGIMASGRLERGDTASAVVAVADAHAADLVILAVRGLAGLSAFWANAVTRKVAGAYGGALLLIPRAKPE
jgi:nucleotide-binding universal stress UspA family protein